MKRMFSLALIASMLVGPAYSQSAADGEKTFKKCTGCHKVGPGAKNRTGPVLTGVVGRPAGSFEGFNYSKSMLAAGAAGLVWSEDNIFNYVSDPTAFLRIFLNDPKARAKMSFKLKDEDDRRDIIAYLGTFESAKADVPKDGFCIVNSANRTFLFATETREGVRQVSSLKPGAQLCAVQTAAVDGIVTVYNGQGDYEGCNRIVPVGTAEEMLGYAESGRCGWSSHNS